MKALKNVSPLLALCNSFPNKPGSGCLGDLYTSGCLKAQKEAWKQEKIPWSMMVVLQLRCMETLKKLWAFSSWMWSAEAYSAVKQTASFGVVMLVVPL